MNILISNDDGYKADGIRALFKELDQGHEVNLVAPDTERSSCGHGVSLDQALRMEKITDREYRCSGLPADCILVGLGVLYKNKKPDLIISGINNCANLGQDRYYSGTIAAAREATFRGVKSLAVSLCKQPSDEVGYYGTASSFVSKFIASKLWELIPPMHLININIPNIPEEDVSGVKLTRAGFQRYTEEVIERVDHRGKNYYWIGGAYEGFDSIDGSDATAVSEGFISVELQNLSGTETTSDLILKSLIEGLKNL